MTRTEPWIVVASVVQDPCSATCSSSRFPASGREIDTEAPRLGEASTWFAEHLDVDACAYIVYSFGTAEAAARGHARACVRRLLEWFRHETSAAKVDPAASEDGLALDESLGRVCREQPALRLSLYRD